MTREVSYKQVITYTVSREEALEAIIERCETSDKKALLPGFSSVEGVDDCVVFVYEYNHICPDEASP